MFTFWDFNNKNGNIKKNIGVINEKTGEKKIIFHPKFLPKYLKKIRMVQNN